MGFNKVDSKNQNMEFISKNSYFYFVHSHKLKIIKEEKISNAITNYGENFVSYVEKGNIFGAQFHPEKSNNSGLIFLKKFCELK